MKKVDKQTENTLAHLCFKALNGKREATNPSAAKKTAFALYVETAIVGLIGLQTINLN